MWTSCRWAVLLPGEGPGQLVPERRRHPGMVEHDALEVGGEVDLEGLDPGEVAKGVGRKGAGAVLDRAAPGDVVVLDDGKATDVPQGLGAASGFGEGADEEEMDSGVRGAA